MASNFCRNCGFRLTEGKPFCGNCGTKVIVRETAPAQPAATADLDQVTIRVPHPVAPAATAAATVPAAPAAPVPEARPEAPVMNQPMQTLVTYHPEKPLNEELPAGALQPVPEVAAVPASAPAAVPAAPEAVAPAVPGVQTAPALSVEPKKKKNHTGLIIGLVFGGAFLIGFIAFGVFFLVNGVSKVPAGSGTILDRIETMEEVSSGKNYTIYDKAFDKKIESARWWDYDGTMKSQGVYFSNTKTLAFSIKVDEKVGDKLYFAYYYSKDNDFDKDELSDPIYSVTTGPSYYKDGSAFYNIECEKSLKPGYYAVIVSKDKSFRNPYAVAYAKILDEEPEVPNAAEPEDPDDEATA